MLVGGTLYEFFFSVAGVYSAFKHYLSMLTTNLSLGRWVLASDTIHLGNIELDKGFILNCW